ncbi:hypothetical protein BKI52_32935 [marine bacterium AO1-C]|nr:hypothetical protein BKI52_32935 [marine bacterium AO1-C]
MPNYSSLIQNLEELDPTDDKYSEKLTLRLKSKKKLDELIVLYGMFQHMFRVADKVEIPHRLENWLRNEATTFINNHLRVIFGDSDPKNLEQNFTTYYAKFFNHDNASLLNYTAILSFEDIESDVYQIEDKARQSLQELESIIAKARDQAVNMTAESYAKVFEEEGQKYKKVASRALIGGISSVILFILVLVLFSVLGPKVYDIEKKVYLVEGILARFLTASILLFVINFCAKQYNINNHLAALNIQRKQALASSFLFLESIDKEDSATRNLLVLEIAKTIYSQTKTGYISDKTIPPDTKKLTDIIKIVNAKS